MTPQNLAVCFGPVLLPARQAAARPRIRSSGPGVSNAVDFKRHIEVLHYLLQAWPGELALAPAPAPPIVARLPLRCFLQWPIRVSGFRQAAPPSPSKLVPGCLSNQF